MLVFALSGLGCATSGTGRTNAEAAREPEPDPNRSVDTPGGHVTFGFQASPVDRTDRVRVTGVLVDLDGREHVTDLGEWEGELTVVDDGEGELLHVHLEGPENHEFVAVPVGDSELDLLVDGQRVGRLHFEAAALIEAEEPLRLTTPRLLEE